MMSWRIAIRDDNAEALKIALQGNVEIADQYSSRTPLRQAAFDNSVACVKWLIAQGAFVNSVNSEGWAALHLAIWRDHAVVAKLLLHAGANTTARTSSDHPPLALCFQRDARACARLLMDRGVTDGIPANPPEWVDNFLFERKRCRYTVLLVLGIRRWRHSSVMAGNGRDAIRLIAQQLWSMRFIEGLASDVAF